jgi:hypothetical protein
MRFLLACFLTVCLGSGIRMPVAAQQGQIKVQKIDLTERLAAARLRAVNRNVTTLQGGPTTAVHVDEGPGPGVVWIEGTGFAEGRIELEVRGRNVFQQSFVGIAFHRNDDSAYEAVYVRPFNFRAIDPISHKHAVQYIAVPDYDWPRLRQEFADEFENPVDPSVSPTDWLHLQVVVKNSMIEVYVGAAKSPALRVRKLGKSTQGMIGLWTGNLSGGDFSDLKITSLK